MFQTYLISIFTNHLLDSLRYFYDAHTTLKTWICLKMIFSVYILYQKSSSVVSKLINDHTFNSFTLEYGCYIKISLRMFVRIFGYRWCLRVQLFTLYDNHTIFIELSRSDGDKYVRKQSGDRPTISAISVQTSTLQCFLRLLCENRADRTSNLPLRTQMLYIHVGLLSYADRILYQYETWMVKTIQHDQR